MSNSMCLSPRSEDVLATQIASSAIGAEKDNHSVAQGGEEGKRASLESFISRAHDAGASAGADYRAPGPQACSSRHNDSVLTSSFQMERGSMMITDETLEIDVAQYSQPSSQRQNNAGSDSKSPPAALAREQPPSHHNQAAESDPATTVVSEKKHGDGKIERLFADGKKMLVFSNGTRKEVFPGGGSVVHFSNQDIKPSFPDGKVVYYYAETRTTHTTLADGQVYVCVCVVCVFVCA